MNERIYNTMKRTGTVSLIMGILTLVAGLSLIHI